MCKYMSMRDSRRASNSAGPGVLCDGTLQLRRHPDCPATHRQRVHTASQGILVRQADFTKLHMARVEGDQRRQNRRRNSCMVPVTDNANSSLRKTG